MLSSVASTRSLFVAHHAAPLASPPFRARRRKPLSTANRGPSPTGTCYDIVTGVAVAETSDSLSKRPRSVANESQGSGDVPAPPPLRGPRRSFSETPSSDEKAALIDAYLAGEQYVEAVETWENIGSKEWAEAEAARRAASVGATATATATATVVAPTSAAATAMDDKKTTGVVAGPHHAAVAELLNGDFDIDEAMSPIGCKAAPLRPARGTGTAPGGGRARGFVAAAVAAAAAAPRGARESVLAPRYLSYGAGRESASAGGAGSTPSPREASSLAPSARTTAPPAPPPPRHRPPPHPPPDAETSMTSQGLPEPVVEYYRDEKNITRLHAWQAECLSTPGVSDGGKNLVYCAPTSGGKSIVADILLMKRLVADGFGGKRREKNAVAADRGGNLAIIVLPFISLCDERANELAKLLKLIHVDVKRFYGGRGGALPPRDSKERVLLVCTPEKANDVVSKLIEDDRVRDLAAVVVDELHMVQDESRGSTLELMLTKLLFASSKAAAAAIAAENVSPSSDGGDGGKGAGSREPLSASCRGSKSAAAAAAAAKRTPQIIGMSATLPNVDGLAKWLDDAALYVTDYRPVALRLSIKLGSDVYPLPSREEEVEDGEDDDVLSERRKVSLKDGDDASHVAQLAQETMDRGAVGGGVIVFCSAKFQCEVMARMLSKKLRVDADARASDGLDRISASLRNVNPNATDTANRPALATTVANGVAWHHAALHAEEKRLVEDGFRSGAIRVICCTSTMAAGVNLPASRVIIAHPYIYRQKPARHALLSSRDLKQAAGRAGRAGLADRGEAFVVVPEPSEIDCDFAAGGGGGGGGGKSKAKSKAALARELARRLLSEGDALSSTIAGERMRRVMLEALAGGLVKSARDVQCYIQCTLLNALNDFQEVTARGAKDALAWLAQRGFMSWNEKTAEYTPSPLGRAAAAGRFEPDEAAAVVDVVKRARRGLNLESDLHLLFLCVPPDPPAPMDVDADGGGGGARAAKDDPLSSASIVAARNKPVAPPKTDTTCRLNPTAFVSVYDNLTEHEHDVATRCGVLDSYARQLKMSKRDKTPEDRASRRVCHRFMKALQLRDLVAERDVADIARAFSENGKDANVNGFASYLAQLQEQAVRYAGQVAALCGPMGWGDVEVLLARLQDRIAAGAREEIVSLTQIPMISAGRARALYNAGYRSPEAILRLDQKKLAGVLKQCRGARGGEMKAAAIILRGARALCAEARRLAREESEAKLKELEALPAIDADADADAAVDDDDDAEAEEAMREVDVADLLRSASSFDLERARGCVVVRDAVAVDALHARWSSSEFYAFVLQPSAKRDAPPVGIALSFPFNPLAVFYAPIVHGAGGGGATRGLPWTRVRDVLSRSGVGKVTVDLKPQLRAMGAGATIAAPVVDVKIAAWVLHPDEELLKYSSQTGWDALNAVDPDRARGPCAGMLERFAGDVDADAIRAASKWRGPRATADGVNAGGANAAFAVASALSLDALVRAKLADPRAPSGLEDALRAIEMPLVPVLASMERAGVAFAPATLSRQLRRATKRVREIETEAVAVVATHFACRHPGMAPPEFNLASSDDVARVLFDAPPAGLGAEPPRGAKPTAARGRRSTRQDDLLALVREQGGPIAAFPKLVLEHRSLRKLLDEANEFGRLAKSELGGDAAAAADESVTIRLRGVIHQTNTGTGRLAMEDPNLQCVPRPREFALSRAYPERLSASGRVSPGTDAGAEETLAIRNAFRAPRGKKLIAFDYKQIELRVIAHLSCDRGLIAALCVRSVDPFKVIAARWKGDGTTPKNVSDEDRAKAKELCYGICYGAGVGRYQQAMGVTELEARAAIEDFKRSLPGVERWKSALVKDARERTPPHVRTIAGRCRFLPSLNATGAGGEIRAADERKAINTACQGSAADIVKRVMIELHAKLTSGGGADDDDEWAPLREVDACEMVLQVHDELLFEVDERKVDVAVRAIRGVMERAREVHDMKVPLPVRVSVGDDWGRLREVNG